MIIFKIRIKSFNLKDIYFPNNKLFIFLKLKRKIDRITVLRSPHIYKKSREQFQINIYKRAVYILNFLKEKVFLTVLKNYLNRSILDLQCVAIDLKTNLFKIKTNKIKYLASVLLKPNFILYYLSHFEARE